MKSRHILKPPVYGVMGDSTVLDQSCFPPRVHHFHLVLDSPPRDDLHTTFPCYLISGRLARHLLDNGLTGIEVAELQVELNEQYREMHPDEPIPDVRWLKVISRDQDADFRLDSTNQLEVSYTAMAALRGFRLEECRIYDAANAPTRQQMTDDVWAKARLVAEELRRAR